MKILGIESSCDETSASVVELLDDGSCRMHSLVTASSMDIHARYGGVVPEIAARSHIEAINPVIAEAVASAVCSKSYKANSTNHSLPTYEIRHTKYESDPWDLIDGIAVTYGAGLSGSLLVGVLAARTLAILHDKPLYAINHVEGHVYANFITSASETFTQDHLHITLPAQAPHFPCLALIVSGGHSQLVLFRNHDDYTLLGQTTDDAIGEAFDKVAKITGLPYPGGPNVAKAAENGDPFSVVLPKPKVPGRYDFSYSGLKTAVLRASQALVGADYHLPSTELPQLLSEAQKANIAASFQRVAVEMVVDKTIQAYDEFQPKSVVIAGGVAANQELRRQLRERLPIAIEYAPPLLCTDNGAMIAALGCYKASLRNSEKSHTKYEIRHTTYESDPYSLAINPNLKMHSHVKTNLSSRR